MNGMKSRTRRNAKPLAIFLSCAALGSMLPACGDGGNVFSFAASKNDKDKGKSALAKGDYDTAISELERSLQKNPDDPQARSMLANAYLKKSGLDELRIASQVMAAKDGGNQDDLAAIINAMPAGTPENRERMEKAVATLSGIPPEKRTEEQNYQLAIAQTSLAMTVVKQSTGGAAPAEMTDEQIDAIPEKDAETVYNSLTGASTSLNNAGNAGKAAGAESMSNVANELQSQEGATPAEKLKTLLRGKK